MDKIKELKSKAYDFLAQIQFLQAELGKVNDEIAREVAALPRAVVAPPAEEKPKE